MILKISPTRLSLLSLKRELKVAKRGHKLLKDKRDGLMKKFMEVVREVKDLRTEVERDLGGVFRSYLHASSVMAPHAVHAAFMLPNADISLSVKQRTVMSVPIPELLLEKKGSVVSYGLLETSGDLDTAVAGVDRALPRLILLAEREKAVENLALEIERTRRRASALENTKIPNLQDTIRFITSRLEEQARDAVVSTMRIKAMIESRQVG